MHYGVVKLSMLLSILAEVRRSLGRAARLWITLSKNEAYVAWYRVSPLSCSGFSAGTIRVYSGRTAPIPPICGYIYSSYDSQLDDTRYTTLSILQ